MTEYDLTDEHSSFNFCVRCNSENLDVTEYSSYVTFKCLECGYENHEAIERGGDDDDE